MLVTLKNVMLKTFYLKEGLKSKKFNYIEIKNIFNHKIHSF